MSDWNILAWLCSTWAIICVALMAFVITTGHLP